MVCAWLQVLPVWDCWLQDETANRILQIITAAVQVQYGTQELPQLKPWVKVWPPHMVLLISRHLALGPCIFIGCPPAEDLDTGVTLTARHVPCKVSRLGVLHISRFLQILSCTTGVPLTGKW